MALIAGLGLLGLIVDNHLASRAAQEAERLQRSEDHLARAQRIAHTGSIERNLRTGAVAWSGETYRIFGLDPNRPRPWGKLSSISFILTIAPPIKSRNLLSEPPLRAIYLTGRAFPSGFVSFSRGARLDEFITNLNWFWINMALRSTGSGHTGM